MPIVRPARLPDFAAIREIHGQFHRSFSLDGSSFQSNLDRYTVVVDGDRILGYCNGHHASTAWDNNHLTPTPAPGWSCSFIESMVVHREARGDGLGRLLLEDFMDRGRRAGSSWIVLTPANHDGIQPELHRFYSRSGLFVLQPKDEHDRRAPWMMGAPLVERPAHTIHPSRLSAQDVLGPEEQDRPAPQVYTSQGRGW